MSSSKQDDSVKLDKINYSIRSSQAIYQYGVGGMVDFKDQTLMTSAPEFWPDKDMLVISDERLARALHVNGFKMAGGKQNAVISYVRFPEWYFCPQCRDFNPLRQWYKEFELNATEKAKDNNPYMTKKLQCPRCHKDLVVTRIVTVCEKGHISDFPWIEWVHAKNFKGQKPVCAHPHLKFTTSGSSGGGMSNIIVECTACGARASLKDAFTPNVFARMTKESGGEYDFRCTGRHPWKHIRESCDCYPKTLQRGSSSVYYPFTVSSLVIPPYSDEVNAKILETEAFREFDTVVRDRLEDADSETEKIKIIRKQVDKRIGAIMAQAGLKDTEEETAREFLAGKYLETPEEVVPDSIKYKEAEYLALNGTGIKPGKRGEFDREEMKTADYGLPFIRQVSLIHKVKKVQAQTGFTRISPAEKTEEGTSPSKIVSIKDYTTDWYPAIQVYGEGIFIEFDQDALDRWAADNPEVQKRAAILNRNNKAAFPETDRTVTPRFVLLHTISHLLIKQLSFECGYNIAALSERLYISEKTGNMAGILIYTADGDSEGTLGGLVRQGRPDVFPATFRKAIESAVACSNDPVCSLSTGQGRNSLNLSACYSCTLIPETSCEEFNSLLDRGMVVGTMENPGFGLYSDYVYGKKSWDSQENLWDGTKTPVPGKTEDKQPPKNHVVSLEGTDLERYTYAEIWKMMLDDAQDDPDIAFLSGASKRPEFETKGKPVQYPSYTVKETGTEGSCLLAWKKSKVLLFGAADEEDCSAAENSDFICISTGDAEAVNKLLNSIREEK